MGTLKIKNLATRSKCVKDWDKVPPPRRVRARDSKLVRYKVRLGKVYLSSTNKDCHNVGAFSEGPLKLTCAAILNKYLA
jgi:hypothetical protein